MNKAAGTFDVKINPLPPYNTSADAKLARMSIDKQFHGDLDATSQGEMLSAGTDIKGIGRVRCDREASHWNIKRARRRIHVAAQRDHDSRRTRLKHHRCSRTPERESWWGSSGTMNIIIEKGKHSYEFQYSMPD